MAQPQHTLCSLGKLSSEVPCEELRLLPHLLSSIVRGSGVLESFPFKIKSLRGNTSQATESTRSDYIIQWLSVCHRGGQPSPSAILEQFHHTVKEAHPHKLSLPHWSTFCLWIHIFGTLSNKWNPDRGLWGLDSIS